MKIEKWENVVNGKLIYYLLLLVLFIAGGTYAYWSWSADENQWSNVSFIIEPFGDPELGYTCSATGGEPLTAESLVMMPTTCSSVFDDSLNNKSVLKREITTYVDITNDEVLAVNLDLWLTVEGLSTPLSESQNFKYVVTTSETSCTSDIVASGSFNGKEIEDKIYIISDEFTSSGENKYYLYIWLDQDETNPATAGQSFSFSLGGQCYE